MAIDPYQVLGVARGAGADEISPRLSQAGPRRTTRIFTPGNKAAEERFKAINTANDLLSDPEKRGRFDRGEIDAAGDPKYQPPPYGDFAQGPRGAKYGPGGSPFGQDGGDVEDLFADFLNAGGRRQTGPRRGRDRSYTLDVDFLDAVNGAHPAAQPAGRRGLRSANPGRHRSGPGAAPARQGRSGARGAGRRAMR